MSCAGKKRGLLCRALGRRGAYFVVRQAERGRATDTKGVFCRAPGRKGAPHVEPGRVRAMFVECSRGIVQ